MDAQTSEEKLIQGEIYLDKDNNGLPDTNCNGVNFDNGISVIYDPALGSNKTKLTTRTTNCRYRYFFTNRELGVSNPHGTVSIKAEKFETVKVKWNFTSLISGKQSGISSTSDSKLINGPGNVSFEVAQLKATQSKTINILTFTDVNNDVRYTIPPDTCKADVRITFKKNETFTGSSLTKCPGVISEKFTDNITIIATPPNSNYKITGMWVKEQGSFKGLKERRFSNSTNNVYVGLKRISGCDVKAECAANQKCEKNKCVTTSSGGNRSYIYGQGIYFIYNICCNY